MEYVQLNKSKVNGSAIKYFLTFHFRYLVAIEPIPKKRKLENDPPAETLNASAADGNEFEKKPEETKSKDWKRAKKGQNKVIYLMGFF